MQPDKLIPLTKEYLKSYLSINSYIGCTINCAYCFLAPIEIVPMRPIKVMDEKKLVANTINDKYFKKDVTVLSLNNRTDPFINNEVAESTYKLLKELDNNKLKNIVTVTTKGLITEEMAKRLSGLRNINLVIIVTFNGINKKLQPISEDCQKMTMKNISRYPNIKLLHQCRPIMKDINDDYETLNRLVEFAHKYCDATIYQGIRVNPAIQDRLEKRNYKYKGKMGKHKEKDEKVDIIFGKIRKKHKNKYPIFDHTSCCLSFVFKQSDYNMHYKKRSCSKVCPNYILCHTSKDCNIDKKKISQELKKIGVKTSYSINNNNIYINGTLNDEQRSYIKHILKLIPFSNVREITYSEKIMEEKNENKNSI